jgi:hypothetical protein
MLLTKLRAFLLGNPQQILTSLETPKPTRSAFGDIAGGGF